MEHIPGMFTGKCEYRNDILSPHVLFFISIFFNVWMLKISVSLPPPGLRLELLVTWGDSHYMGLTGLEVVGKDGEYLPLDLGMMAASPCDLNDLPEYGRDQRTLDKYVQHKVLLMVQKNRISQ